MAPTRLALGGWFLCSAPGSPRLESRQLGLGDSRLCERMAEGVSLFVPALRMDSDTQGFLIGQHLTTLSGTVLGANPEQDLSLS